MLGDMISGLVAGVVTALAFHPLEVVEICVQTQMLSGKGESQLGLLETLVWLYSRWGLSGLYFGIIPNAVCCGVGWGVYFVVYEGMKGLFRQESADLANHELVLCALVGGIASIFAYNPPYLVKIHMVGSFASRASKNAKDDRQAIQGTATSYAKDVLNRNGYAGLMSGVAASQMGNVELVVQMLLYERMKIAAHTRGNLVSHVFGNPSALNYFFMAALSTLVAVLLTYPYKPIRAASMSVIPRFATRNPFKCALIIVREHGWGGLYSGIIANVNRRMLSMGLLFFVVEPLRNALMTLGS